MATHSFSDLEFLWAEAGGPNEAKQVAAAIALAESRGRDIVQQGQPYSRTGWGLWQITPGDSEPAIGINQALLNPLTNAQAAVAKYHARGDTFNAWSTYTSGAYLAFMPRSSSSSSPGGSRPRPGAGGGSSSGSGGGGVSGALNSAVGDAEAIAGGGFDALLGLIGGPLDFLKAMLWLVSPVNWLRGVEVLFGFTFMLLAVILAARADEPLAEAGVMAATRGAV